MPEVILDVSSAKKNLIFASVLMRAIDEGKLHFFHAARRKNNSTNTRKKVSLSIKNRNQFEIDQFYVLL